MKIINEKPPVWNNVCAALKINPKNTLFTYGDIIYNPDGIVIPDDLMEHEKTHIKQQAGQDPALWWGKYLRDQKFRLDQESEAYGVQYRYICKTTKDRERRNKILYAIAGMLSGPLYGYCIDHTEAMILVKKRAGV